MSVLVDLFSRYGKIAGRLEDNHGVGDAIETSHQGATGINAQFNDADRDQVALTNGRLQTYIDVLADYNKDLRSDGRTVVIDEMDDIGALGSKKDIATAAQALADKLASLTETVSESTVAAGAPAYTGTGTHKLLVHLNDPDGNPLQNIRAETLTLVCTTDAQDGTLIAGSEQWTITGEAAVDNLDRAFPAGSAANFVVLGVSGTIDERGGPGGNLVNNGDFEKFTLTNTPDNWDVTGGTVGTTILKSTTSLRGLSSLEIKGDGAQVTTINQPFGTTGKSAAKIKSKGIYGTSFWLRDGATPVDGAAVLSVVVTDAGGTDIGTTVKTVTLSTLTGSWSHHEITWEAPADIPSDARVTLKLDVFIAAGESFLIDELVITELSQDTLAKGAVRLAVIAGDVDTIKGDTITVALTRTGGKLLEFMDAMMGLFELGIIMPEEPDATADYKDALVS